MLADGPYCDIFFRDGIKRTVAKTLKTMLELNPGVFVRINRKVAVLKQFVELEHADKVVLKNGEVYEFSRRRKPSYIMKKLGVLLFFLAFGTSVFCQTGVPESKVLSVKKVVKVGTRFFIETTSTTTSYVELTTEQLLGVEMDDEEVKRDEEEVDRVEKLKKERQAERIERNRLLRDALRRGYEPEVRTLEDVKRINDLKRKLRL